MSRKQAKQSKGVTAEMGTPVKVYGPVFSPTVSRVLTCLNEKDVEFQLVPVNMSKGEHRSPNFLKIHPFAQVPAFQDDHISLFESRAICRYVCEKHGEKGNRELYGTNPLAKASIDQWLEAEGQSFNPPTSTLVFQLAFAPRMKVKQDQGVINQSKEKLKRVLDVYDTKLGETRYLAGDQFTLADLSHIPNIHYLVSADDDTASLFISERENVARWWTEISTRESWKKVVDLYPKP